jgi:oxalate decarboxylase/phosphoglucose isomerase-like protein (cupin superfamily)
MSSLKLVNLKDLRVEQILGGPVKVVFKPDGEGPRRLFFAVGIFSPGEGLDPHLHPESEEVYYVIRGKGMAYVGKEKKKTPIEPETALYVPAGMVHSVTNTGEGELVIAFHMSPGTEQAVAS